MNSIALPGRLHREDPDLGDRLREVFQALVSIHGETARPVGSETLAASAGLRLSPASIRNTLGELESLGLLENHYGVLAFMRSDIVAAQPLQDDAADPEWPLLARVALAGCQVVAIPEPLSVHSGRPGRVGDVPGEGLTVLEAFEQRPVAELRGLAQLAATLGAALERLSTKSSPEVVPPVVARLRRKVGSLVR